MYLAFSYIGIYGWTKTPLIEYYIVDDYFEGAPAYAYGGNKKGTYTLDGDTYDLYKVQRYNAPSIIDFPAPVSPVIATKPLLKSMSLLSIRA